MTQKRKEMYLIRKSQWYLSKNVHKRGTQNRKHQNKNFNCYLQHRS